MKPIKLAVIGSGYWGQKMVGEYISLQNNTGKVELKAVVDPSPERINQTKIKHGEHQYKNDYKELLDDKELQAVHIATPNETHYSIALDFLKNGKNVLLEKPMTLVAGEAKELLDLADKNNLVLSTGHIFRFNNSIRELYKDLRTGYFGNVYYLSLTWADYLPPQFNKDIIMDLAPHPVDICNYLLDMWPQKVTCWGQGFRTKQEEVAFITLEYITGLSAYIVLSWLDPDKKREVGLLASKAVAKVDCDKQVGFYRNNGRQEMNIKPNNTILDEIEHFINCVNSNINDDPFINLSHGKIGVKTVQILNQAQNSLNQRRTLDTALRDDIGRVK